jgi:hypothetical protein
VLTRQLPYHDADGNAPDMSAFNNNIILWYTDATNRDPPLRPSPMSGVPELDDLIEHAWAQDPAQRPTAAEIYQRLANSVGNFAGGDVPLHI